jgi:cytoskeletal protein CcmA (bactofilin family)
MSVFCPLCKKRLVLEDFKIDSYYAVREFFTCGEIVVEKKGHVVASIRGGALTVKGKVQGHAAVRGVVQIRKTGQFRGELQAPSLVIEEGAVFDAVVSIGVP